MRHYIIALHKFNCFAKTHELNCSFDFVSVLCSLISERPIVVSAALNKFADLSSLVLSIIKNAFHSRFSDPSQDDAAIDYVHFKSSCSNEEGYFPMTLLRTSIALISNWNEVNLNTSPDMDSSNSIIKKLASWMFTDDCPDQKRGAAGASYVKSGVKAISIEYWVTMVKAHCSYIGRQAALNVRGKKLRTSVHMFSSIHNI